MLLVPIDPEGTEFVTLGEAAELLGKEVRTIRRYIQSNQVTSYKDKKNGQVMVKTMTLPGIMSVQSYQAEAADRTEEKQMEEETLTREQPPEVTAAIINIRAMSKIGLFTDSAHRHIDKLTDKLIARDDSFTATLMKQMKWQGKEIIRLSKELRKARATEEKLLDGEVTRTLAIDEFERGREQKKQILTIIASLGLARLGDEKMQKLSAMLGTILSGGLPSDLVRSSPPQSDRKSGPSVAPASKETTEG